jgi:copper ion binding protein
MIKTIQIEGMKCIHCAKHVKEALEQIDGVKSVDVNLEKKSASVELLKEIADDKFIKAIEEEGYKVISIK